MTPRTPHSGDEIKPERATWTVEQAAVFVSTIREMLGKLAPLE
jgi:hypothetical protein